MIGDDGIALLANALAHTPCVLHLDVSNSGMSHTGARALAQGLKHVSQLLTLTIQDNSRVGNAGLNAIVSHGLRHTPLLETLSVSAGIGLHGKAGGQALAAALSACPALTRLCAGKNQLSSEGVAALAAALPRAAALAHLELADCDAGDAGAAAVAAALPRLTLLENLDLSSNQLGESAADDLADALPRAPRLAELSLKHNQLDAAAVDRLARGGRLLALTALNLTFNPLHAAGGAALGRLLRGSPRLTALHVSACSLGPEGMTALAAALCRGPAGGARAAALKELSVASNCFFGDAGAPLLEVCCYCVQGGGTRRGGSGCLRY
jgi:Ran GTPase-activating protein (RanGAP) involved in mRNA processing and transport